MQLLTYHNSSSY